MRLTRLLATIIFTVSVGGAYAWGQGAGVDPAARRLLVHLADGGAGQRSAARDFSSLGLQIQAHPRFDDWAVVSVPAGIPADLYAEQLSSLPHFDAAGSSLKAYIHQVPNDPWYRPMEDPYVIHDPFWDEDISIDQDYLYDTNAQAAWDVSRGSADTVIAVIDSGVAFFHEDIDGLIWENPGEIPGDGIDNDGNGYIDDVNGWDFVGANVGNPLTDDPASEDNYANVWDPEWWDDSWGQPADTIEVQESELWADRLATIDPAIGNAQDDNNSLYGYDEGVNHGTNVAGMIGAVTDNATTMAGMSWGCTLMPLRVVNPEGWGWGLDAAEAIRYAADNGADIINMSFGFGVVDFENPPEEGDPGYADYLEAVEVRDALLYASNRGAILVASAGNSGAAGIEFPAALPEVISVGAVDPWEERSAFSTYAGADDLLDIMAPGDGTVTTWVWDMFYWAAYGAGTVELGASDYDWVSGTSFSAPLISGLAGLYHSAFPDLTYLDFREALHMTGKDLGDPGYDPYYGFGLVDAGGVMNYALLQSGQEPIPEPGTMALMAIGIATIAWRRRRHGSG